MNTGENTLHLTVRPSSSLDYIVTVSEVYFTLTPGQTKVLQLDFNSKIGTLEFLPGVYTGKLIAKSVLEGSETEENAEWKSIPIVVEIESKPVMFDTNLNVYPQQKRIFQGEDIVVSIRLFNLIGIEPTSVLMEYSIKDLDGNSIITETETVVVATQASFTKVMQIPIDLEPETYVFSVKSEHEALIGTSSYLFEIIEYGVEEWEIPPVLKACVRNITCVVGLSVLVVVFLVVIISLIYFIIFRRGKPRLKPKPKLKLKPKPKPEPKPKPVKAVKEFVPPKPRKPLVPKKPKVSFSEKIR